MSKTFLVLTSILLTSPLTGVAQTTAFTYQGRLNTLAGAAHGQYEISFTLFNAPTNGVALASTQAVATVSNGLFTTLLDFGTTPFNGSNRWLEIGVTLFGSDQPVTTLAPRQLLTPVPYAIHAASSAGLTSLGHTPLEIEVDGQRVLRLEPTSPWNPEIVGAPNVIGGSGANFISPEATGSTIAGGGAEGFQGIEQRNAIASTFSTISGGRSNTIDTQASGATIAGGSQNTILSEGTHATIGGGFLNWVAEDAGASTIAGGWLNRILGDGATIGGGYGNEAAGYATVGGGQNNRALAPFSAISGGDDNFVSPLADESVIAGGGHNTIGSESFHSTISGGVSNILEGKVERSTIGGGAQNRISFYANGVTIAGGLNNRVDGPTGGTTISGGSGNHIEDEASGATIAGGFDNVVANNAGSSVVGGGEANSVRAGLAAIGGGAGNTVLYPGHYASINGGQSNSIRNYASSIAGGARNSVGSEYAHIGGGEGNQVLEGAERSVIAGGSSISIGTNSANAFIGGGGANRIHAEAAFSSIVGGFDNQIGAGGGVVGGGRENSIDDGAHHAVVVGGAGNGIGFGSANSMVGGGEANYVLPNSPHAMIPGGRANVATNHSFAAGQGALALHTGAFLWADSSNPAFTSAATNEFAIRATGGFRLVTAVDAVGNPTAGVTVPSGSGSWASLSDRHAKEHFAATDGEEILAKVAKLPLATWNYRSQGESVRHLGPMAQDFHAAFGLGEGDRTISTIDADGVALAAIQGLNRKVEDLRTALNRSERENATLQQRLEVLKRAFFNSSR